jgi:hypothetical protein
VWEEDRAEWENYTAFDVDNKWYQEGCEYQQELGLDDLDQRSQAVSKDPNLDLSGGIANHVFNLDGNTAAITPQKRYYLPIWQVSGLGCRRYPNGQSI